MTVLIAISIQVNKETNKGRKVKKSSFIPSPKLLQVLKNIYSSQNGTVTYVFKEERIGPKGKEIVVRSSLSASINPQILFGEFKGKPFKRSPQDILEVFETTAHDLGADHFILS